VISPSPVHWPFQEEECMCLVPFPYNTGKNTTIATLLHWVENNPFSCRHKQCWNLISGDQNSGNPKSTTAKIKSLGRKPDGLTTNMHIWLKDVCRLPQEF
jgi:hypothetical protein